MVVLKWTGVIVMISLLAATLGIFANLMKRDPVYKSDCINVQDHNVADVNETLCIEQTEIPDLNNSLCTYARQYALSNNYFVTVCRYHGIVRIDVRLFLNGIATIRGIFLNNKQWNSLWRLRSQINGDITEARDDKWDYTQ
ncbi:hypothetical protein BOW52_11060 [Solemya elarraichensis gill symbiont]|uniref:Uncharacterized protein n=1 Tax=Solemya elarraichensis gill symbiont TaxID=1918949 RepID=A0A1T2KSY0_9GAMM|nr:hypothetical protein BOW52_11060 [Solemya elarraichensis gill symbiont]